MQTILVGKCFLIFDSNANAPIGEALNIVINPINIRLIPAEDDPYRWQFEPEKSYLFAKHLSKLSVGPLMELCREVGASFYAVPPAKDGSMGFTKRESSLRREKQQRPHVEESIAMRELKKRLQSYRQERRRLKHQNVRQMALIAKYRTLMTSFLQDSSFISS